MFKVKSLYVPLAVAVFLALPGCSELSNREDFASQLKNKTEKEVLTYAGKPADIESTTAKGTSWHYKSRTFDVATRATDPETTVIFAPAPDGKLHVAEVRFE